VVHVVVGFVQIAVDHFHLSRIVDLSQFMATHGN